MIGAWDYVIVGGGTAGCVLANRLSANGHDQVLLIEAGPNDRSPFIHVPAGLMKLNGLHWGYVDEPDASRMDQTMPWMAGKVLGGGSSVNGMVWVRGNRADFDHWSELGCTGWDFASVLPFFKRAERFEGGEDGYRGGSGPQHVGYQRAPHLLTDAFIEAADASGFPVTDDYNGERQEGVGVAQTAQRRGFRQSEARAYLSPRVRMRKNLTILTNTLARRVLFEGTRAVGVEIDGPRREVEARKEVIVSSGGIASPKILMISGVGPADHLHEVGVEVVADVGGVGKNLQEHPILTMIWNVNVSTFNVELTPRSMLRHGADFALRGKGPAAASAGHAIVFAALRNDSPWPEFELLFAPFGLVGADAGDTDSEVLESAGDHDVTQMEMLRRPSISLIVQLLHPHSRGEILLRSKDPDALPVIHHSLLGDENDVADLIRAGRTAREIIAQPPISKYVIGEALPGPIVDGDDTWEGYAHYGGWGAQHPVGTNKMGTDHAAVVDPQLRVRGVSGLRVVDASVMPTITSGNTNAPTVMIAEKAAEMILTHQ